MLDEYAEDFGTGLENQMPELKPRVLSDAKTYQNNPEMIIPENTQRRRAMPFQQQQPPVQPQMQAQPQMQQSFVPPPPAYQPPIYQQYVYQPGYMPAGPAVQQSPNYQQPTQQPLPEAQPRERINNIFMEESKELNELLRAEERGGCLRNIIFLVTCLLIIAGSFWLSYTLGGRILSGDRKNILPNMGAKLPKIVAKLKSTIISGSDVIKKPEEFKNYKIPGEPRTPILPPEIINLPPKEYNQPKTEAKYLPPVPPMPAAKPALVAKTAYAGPKMYRVLVGSFDTKQEAQDVVRNIKADGFPVFMYRSEGKYRLQIGSFQEKSRATALTKKANEYGYNAFISIK